LRYGAWGRIAEATIEAFKPSQDTNAVLTLADEEAHNFNRVLLVRLDDHLLNLRGSQCPDDFISEPACFIDLLERLPIRLLLLLRFLDRFSPLLHLDVAYFDLAEQVTLFELKL